MSKTYKLNIKNKLRNTRKGKGITSSKPSKVTPYPPLPESPTNRPLVLTSNENLKLNSLNRTKKLIPLANRLVKARYGTAVNRLKGWKKIEPKRNEYGEPKSFFSINNKVGFKPNRLKFLF